MRVTEVDFGNALPIESYGPDFYRLGGEVYPAPTLFAPGHSAAWGGYEDTETLLGLAGQIDVLFIGTGPEITPLPAVFRTTLEEAGLALEIMTSTSACRTYNVLLSEGRRVAVALLATA
ncbi:Mth938-like domain-containing protein [Pararhodobacter oceanensis]|uniref:Mth938-like domain-containing protein n=1 Tax=Pararhodobacter oceanensis TaxID=2172121 RepID=UPI003A92985F